MEMKRCENGHFYDEERSSSCPYCGNGFANSLNVTRPLENDGGGILKGQPLSGGESEIFKTRAIENSSSMIAGQGKQEKTVALIKKDIGLDPIVGLLVCIEGGDRGRDYRIRAENNFIGRVESMDICIRGDETISREGHAVISYDMRNNNFWLSQGGTKGMVYLNDQPVFTPTQLTAYDVIELGKTKLLFIPVCGEKFKWE